MDFGHGRHFQRDSQTDKKVLKSSNYGEKSFNWARRGKYDTSYVYPTIPLVEDIGIKTANVLAGETMVVLLIGISYFSLLMIHVKTPFNLFLCP